MLPAKKRTNNKDKMARFQSQARRGIKGLIIRWHDSAPYADNSDISNTQVTHRNPTQRLVVAEMWARCSHWILNTEMTWVVSMNVIYKTKNKGDKVDEYEFELRCKLRAEDDHKSIALNDTIEHHLNESIAANASLPDGHKNKGTYQTCHFSAEVKNH